MRSWWEDDRKDTLKSPALQAQSVLDLKGRREKTVEKEGQWSEVFGRSFKILRGKEKPNGVLAAGDGTTLSLSSKNGLPSSRWWTEAVNQVASEPPRKAYESDFPLMDGGSYCQVCYINSHKILECTNVKEDMHFVRPRIWNYEACFGTEDEHRRQTWYPAGHYSPPPSHTSPCRTFIEGISSKGCNTQNAPNWCQGLDRSYFNALPTV